MLVVASVNTSQKKSLQNRQPQKMVGSATRVGELKVAIVTSTWGLSVLVVAQVEIKLRSWPLAAPHHLTPLRLMC